MTVTLYVKAFVLNTYDSSTSTPVSFVRFTAPTWPNLIMQQYLYAYGTQNPLATPFPLFPNDAAAIAYYSASGAGALVSAINTNLGVSYYTAYDVEQIDASVGAAIYALQSMLAAVATTGSYSDLSGKPTIPSITTCTHIAPAGASLPTSQNVLTTLLGTLTASVNTTNAAYNDLATKFNTLLTDLQTNNILAAS